MSLDFAIVNLLPAAAMVLSEKVLSRLYGLTRAEARLAAHLVVHEGSPATIATRQGVSVNTIRTHMKRIFAKTGVPGQVDLVRKLLCGPAPYCESGGDLFNVTSDPTAACLSVAARKSRH